MPSSCGVSVQTWGTDSVSKTGMLHAFDAMMFGENVGHAAITLRFPANEEGKKLIEKYCYDTDGNIAVPFILHKASYADGSTEDIYQVRFSWWPNETSGKSIEFDINTDRLQERRGVQFNWSNKAAESFTPESRLYKGILGNQVKTLSPISIEHRRDLGEDQTIRIQAYSKYIALQQELESATTLFNKFKSLSEKDKVKLSKSNSMLLRNVFQDEDVEIPTNDAGNTVKTQINAVLPRIKIKMQDIQREMREQRDIFEQHTEFDELRQEIQSLKQLIPTSGNINFVIHRLENRHGLSKSSDAILYNKVVTVLDRLFPEWRTVVDNPDDMTEGELQKLAKALKEKQADIKKSLRIKEAEFKLKVNFKNEKYVTLGLTEDFNCTLPIKTFPGTTVGTNNGLDVEKMLEKMLALATDNTQFDLAFRNCSDTVGSILEAGLQQPELKEIAANRAWGAFGNPQMVRNAAIKIRDALQRSGKPTLSTLETFQEFNPLQKVAGKLLSIATTDDNNLFVKSIAGLGSATFAGLSLSMYLIRGLANPEDVYNDTTHLLRYAYQRPSYTLRAVATTFIAPVTAAYAIPAGIQVGARTIARRFSKSTSSTPTPPPSSDEARKVNKNVIDIKDTSPKHAIRKFINMLRISEATIPIFDITAMKEIEKLYGNNALLPGDIKALIQDLPEKFKRDVLFANVEFSTIPPMLAKKCSLTAEKFAALDPDTKERLLLDSLLTTETLVATLCNLSLKRVNTVYAEAAAQQNASPNKQDVEPLDSKSANMLFTGTAVNEKPKESDPSPQLASKANKPKKM